MNKSLLTIGIILSLGSVGCAGFGLQQSSSLSGQLGQEQGLDPLWHAEQQSPGNGLETPLYSEQDLGNLWNADEQTPARAGSTRQAKGANLYTKRGLDQLWN